MTLSSILLVALAPSAMHGRIAVQPRASASNCMDPVSQPELAVSLLDYWSLLVEISQIG